MGLEDPDWTVAAIGLHADGALVTDSVSGGSLSTRLAVLHTCSQPGRRTLTVVAYDDAGDVLQRFTRQLTLR